MGAREAKKTPSRAVAMPVAVPLSDLQFVRDESGDVHAVTSWTKDQLKDMPEHNGRKASYDHAVAGSTVGCAGC